MANGKKKSKKKFFVFGGLGLLLVVVLLLVILGGNNENIVPVQTEKVAKRTITQVVSATGKINPVDQVVLRPEVTGEIVELPVEEGQDVKKGQLLIRLKPDQYIARRNKAEAFLQAAEADLKVRKATLDQVKSEYDRIKGLYEKGLVSDSELEVAKSKFLQSEGNYEAQKAQVVQARESYNDAEVELSKTAIYSPMNGTISELNVEMSERVLGSSFSQGTDLMTVADLSRMEATIDVDENDVVLISVGDTARIEIDAFGDKIFTGEVTQIGNSAQTTGTGSQDEVVNFEVKISLHNPNRSIRPGMSCDADIQTETKHNVYSVPIQCVTARTEVPDRIENEDDAKGNNNVKRNGKRSRPDEVVFVVNNNQAKMVKVETGISDDTYIEIKKGLTEDNEVVTGSYRAISKELEDGTKVMVQSKKKDSEEKS